MPKVSVVVPNYNHERFLKHRMESILSQTYQDFEILLLDDCSTDNSRDIIESYRGHPKVKQIVYNDKNTGTPFRQWVKGILLAECEYVWIAESDDYADPLLLETLIRLTDHYPNVGIAYCNSYKVDAEEKEIEELHVYMNGTFIGGPEEVKQMCQYNTITNASSCIIKREYALKAIQGLGKYKTCGDWIFYARVLQYSNLAYTAKKLNYYRWHAKSVSYTACKTDSYVSEGINVIKYVDFNIVRISFRDFLSLWKAWAKKILKTKLSEMIGSAWILLAATIRFFVSRLAFVKPKPN